MSNPDNAPRPPGSDDLDPRYWRDAINYWQDEARKWRRTVQARLVVALTLAIFLFGCIILFFLVTYSPRIGSVFTAVTKGIS